MAVTGASPFGAGGANPLGTGAGAPGSTQGAAAIDAPQPAFDVNAGDAVAKSDASGRERDGCIVTGDNPIGRGLLGGLGVASGVTAGSLLLLNNKTRVFEAAGIGSHAGINMLGFATALVGVCALAFSFGIAPTTTPYLEKPTGSRDDALKAAAAYDRDVAIYKNSAGRYGLFDGKDFDVDNHGPNSFRLGNVNVFFDSLVSRDGDVYRHNDDGTWVNEGVFGGPTVDLAKLDAGKPEDLAKLVGARLGTDVNHNPVLVGEHIGEAAGYGSRADAANTLFEQFGSDIAVLKVGDRFHGFRLTGERPDGADLRASGTVVTPIDQTSVLSGVALRTASKPGEPYTGSRLTEISLARMDAGDAAALASRRLGRASDGSIVRVGQLGGNTKGYPNRDAFGKAAVDSGVDANVGLRLGDRWFMFQPTGTPADITTRLGSGDRIVLRQGMKLMQAVGTDGNLAFVGRAAPFQVSEPVGKSVHLGESGELVVGDYIRSFADRSAVVKYLDDHSWSEYVVIEAKNGRGTFHLYDTAWNDRSGTWDPQLGDVEFIQKTRRYSASDSSSHRDGDYICRETRSGTQTQVSRYTADGDTKGWSGYTWGPWHDAGCTYSPPPPPPPPPPPSSGGSSGGSSSGGSSGSSGSSGGYGGGSSGGSSSGGSSGSSGSSGGYGGGYGGSSGGSGSSSGGSSGDNSNGDF